MKLLFFTKPVIWLLLICYGLYIPADKLPVKPFINIPHLDKFVHFTLFFVLCLLLFRPIKRLNLKHFVLAPLFTILLGAVLESVQHLFSQTRSSDLYDFLANTFGVLVSIAFYSLFVSGKKWEKLF